jgi:glycosyltransferase involved in cell wall biosynthesis
MVERKGFIYLVRAMPNILKDFPDIKLVMSGEGPEKENLKKEAKKLAVKDSIIFPGFISEVDFPKYMKAAKVFVLPSIVDSKGDTEGSATILLEAMACGTPVVGTKVGGVPYAIKDGIGGYLVGPKNPGQLAEKIVCLLKSENGIGKIGSRYVKENFDTDRIAGLYLEKFEEIFSKQPKKL